jgi:hypothetical protein
MENDKKIQYPEMPPVPDYRGQQRDRVFPVHFIPTPEGSVTLLFDNEFKEWWEKVEAWRREVEAIDEAAKASREAELALGRPVHPENPALRDSKGQDSPTGSIAFTAAGQRESHFPLPTDLEYSRDKAIAALSAFARSVSLSQSGPPRLAPDSMRHSLRCVICAHPDRDAIEGDFVRWRSPVKIAEDYQIADRSSIYRHAHATGLFARRQQEVARVMEQYLELVDHSSATQFDTVTRAVRVYAHLGDDGRWFEPPRTHIIITAPALAQEPPVPANLPLGAPAAAIPPIRQKVSRPSAQRTARRKTKTNNVNRNIPELDTEVNS